MKDKSRNFYTNHRFTFDPSSNMLYFVKRDSEQGDKKSFLSKKEEKEEQYCNLLLWDIAAQEKRFLFDNEQALAHSIHGFYFEATYNEEDQHLVFNQEVHIINYLNLPKRNLNDLLLIETVDLDSKEISLWFANKKGQHLTKVAQLPKQASWHIDVGNGFLRTLVHKKRDLIIQDIPWKMPT